MIYYPTLIEAEIHLLRLLKILKNNALVRFSLLYSTLIILFFYCSQPYEWWCPLVLRVNIGIGPKPQFVFRCWPVYLRPDASDLALGECIDLAIKILQICDTLITRFNWNANAKTRPALGCWISLVFCFSLARLACFGQVKHQSRGKKKKKSRSPRARD